MHLSGIATKTKELVKQLKGSSIQLVDTRKTTPGLRHLEKYAVTCGGGKNHRMGLDDAAMLKENHIIASKSITEAICQLKNCIPWTTKIIVEAETAQQAEEAAYAGADGILLDELELEEIKVIVPKLRSICLSNDKKNKYISIEISGINPDSISQYKDTGVDFISTSAPTTKGNWLDFSMRFNLQ